MRSLLAACCSFAALAAPVFAQVDSSGIEFVTVGDPGNPNWRGEGFNDNRGAVDYAYRIGKYEVTTAQWAEFFNVALDRPSTDRIPHVFAPTQWGGRTTAPTNPGGRRFTVPAGNEMLPAGGIDWRTSAIFCNWLCNDKRTDRAAFLNGAYDVSTFGYFNGGSRFTDQVTRNPGARYYVPSLDEWMKAAHWSSDRSGPGQGGWYLYSNSSDNPFVYGPPGVLRNGQPTTANVPWRSDPFSIPLGAYPTVRSPWGLLDVAGATSEWTEETITVIGDTLPIVRTFEGSSWDPMSGGFDDQVGYSGGDEFPTNFGYDVGFRVAALVPTPASGGLLLAWVGIVAGQRRRRKRG